MSGIDAEAVVHEAAGSPGDLAWIERPSAKGRPDGALVLLHGRGSDMHDLFGLGTALDRDARLHVAAVQAPLQLPPGGWHWYELGGLPTPEPETFGASLARLRTWLAPLPDSTGVPLERTVLVGFSQGCMMTWAAAAASGAPTLAGTVHIAGFLPRSPGHPIDLARLAGRPALVVHGTHDPVIGIEWGRDAHAEAVEAGVDARFVEAPTAHDVDLTGLRAISAFLRDVLPGTS